MRSCHSEARSERWLRSRSSKARLAGRSCDPSRLQCADESHRGRGCDAYWSLAAESAEDQFRVLCGCGHARIQSASVSAAVMREVLIEVGSWMQEHRDRARELRA